MLHTMVRAPSLGTGLSPQSWLALLLDCDICPSRKLQPEIVPAEGTHVELGDDRENGLISDERATKVRSAWRPLGLRVWMNWFRPRIGALRTLAGLTYSVELVDKPGILSLIASNIAAR